MSEDFEKAHVLLDCGKAFEQGIKHEEKKKLVMPVQSAPSFLELSERV